MRRQKDKEGVHDVTNSTSQHSSSMILNHVLIARAPAQVLGRHRTIARSRANEKGPSSVEVAADRWTSSSSRAVSMDREWMDASLYGTKKAHVFLTNGMEFLARFPDGWGIHDGGDGPKVADERYVEQDCISVHQQGQELEFV
jgi:hypothetical protein